MKLAVSERKFVGIEPVKETVTWRTGFVQAVWRSGHACKT